MHAYLAEALLDVATDGSQCLRFEGSRKDSVLELRYFRWKSMVISICVSMGSPVSVAGR
jgi:hypothetical protein